MGTTGESYDSAMAETIIGLFKTEVIHARCPWRPLDAVDYATLEWVDWFNIRLLLEPIGHVCMGVGRQGIERGLGRPPWFRLVLNSAKTGEAHIV